MWTLKSLAHLSALLGVWEMLDACSYLRLIPRQAIKLWKEDGNWWDVIGIQIRTTGLLDPTIQLLSFYSNSFSICGINILPFEHHFEHRTSSHSGSPVSSCELSRFWSWSWSGWFSLGRLDSFCPEKPNPNTGWDNKRFIEIRGAVFFPPSLSLSLSPLHVCRLTASDTILN